MLVRGYVQGGQRCVSSGSHSGDYRFGAVSLIAELSRASLHQNVSIVFEVTSGVHQPS